MVVAVETVVVQALNIATGVEIPVAIPIFVKEDVEVTYGIDGLPTVLNVDFTIEQLDEQNFDTFILTPMAALLTKINNLIAANPEEINAIAIRRKLNYKTSATADGVKNTPYTSKEFDRTAARFQQLNEMLSRCVKFVKSVTTGVELQVRPLSPNRVPVISADGNFLEDGPTAGEVSSAQEYAEQAHADMIQTGEDRIAVAADAALAHEFAENAEDVPITGYPALRSARHYAAKAAASFASVVEGIAAAIHSAGATAGLQDNDEFAVADSVWSWTLAKVTWGQIKSTMATYISSVVMTFTNKTFGGSVLTVQWADDGAAVGPILVLDRLSANPAASDVIPGIYFRGRDSMGNTADYFRLMGRILDPTDGSEDGQLIIQGPINGVMTGLMNIGAGVQVGGAVGGDPGVGKVNAVELQQNGAPVRPTVVSAEFTLSGTSVDITGIPSWATEVMVELSGVSLSGTSDILIQVGSGTIDTTNYQTVCGQILGSNLCQASASTAGFILRMQLATRSFIGSLRLARFGNNWVGSLAGGSVSGSDAWTGGGRTLGSIGAIDRIRITTVNGTDTLDSGSARVRYR